MTTKFWLEEQIHTSYMIYHNMNATSKFINKFKFNINIEKRWFGWDRN